MGNIKKAEIIKCLEVFKEIVSKHGVNNISEIEQGYNDDYYFSFFDKSGEVYEVFHDHKDNKIKILFETGAECELPDTNELQEILNYNQI